MNCNLLKEYTTENKEKLKQYFQERYENNKEQRKIYDAQRRNTPEYKAHQKEYHKNYRLKNKEKIKEQKLSKTEKTILNV